MADDYGYFGSGSTGYAHYMQSFNRNFGSGGGGGGPHRNGGGGGGGCLSTILVVMGVVGILVFVAEIVQ